jgi:hypothetical protein
MYRRKRKWDVPGDPSTVPPNIAQNMQGMPGAPQYGMPGLPGTSAESVMAAASAAARINAQLVAKGFGTKVCSLSYLSNFHSPSHELCACVLPFHQIIFFQEAITKDITINDCKPDIRYQLTKGQTHEQVSIITINVACVTHFNRYIKKLDVL